MQVLKLSSVRGDLEEGKEARGEEKVVREQARTGPRVQHRPFYHGFEGQAVARGIRVHRKRRLG